MMRTVDERPNKESDDVNDSNGDLSEVEADRSDCEGGSEGHHPVGVCSSEGKTSERGSVPDHTAICLDVCRYPLAREDLYQYDRAVVGDSDEEQE